MTPLTEIALGDYDHVRDLTSGRAGSVSPPVRWTTVTSPEEIFGRFLAGEWQGAELSLAVYVARIAHGLRDLIGLPVFPARSFRHGAIYVRAAAGIADPADLAGKRVGIPVWAQTAGVWVRGSLAEDHGLDLGSVEWHQAGVDNPGRDEPVEISIPDGIMLHRHPDSSLDSMLKAGRLDAVISARPPRCCLADRPRFRQLFADPVAAEAEWFRRSGVFPIMHLLVLRRAVVETNPGIVPALQKAFEEAKANSLARLAEATVPYVPMPWVSTQLGEAKELMGADLWPYGVAPNLETLKLFLRFAHEQGVCSRLLDAEDLFPE